MKCPKCEFEVREGWKFCPDCGQSLVNACGTCGNAMDPSWKVCPFCGAGLANAQALASGIDSWDGVLKNNGATATAQASAIKIQGPLPGMEFVYIRPGTFTMGSPPDEPGRCDDETLHEVVLTQGFYMQTTPVTQGQWKAVMGGNPSEFEDGGDLCPVENVSWFDVQDFILKLNQMNGANNKYRLPTEAQWEYACRAGSAEPYSFGCSESMLVQYAWYINNSDGKTHPVAQKLPNAWGLYDMYGNVWEWCQDWFEDYPWDDVTDPAGPAHGLDRVLRGGGWLGDAQGCRSAFRGRSDPGDSVYYLGFRLIAEK